MTKQSTIKVSSIKPHPNNPRLIKDDKFEKLVNSIRDSPKFMSLRPIIVDENDVILGGNMRLKAIQHLGLKDIPRDWVKAANDLTEEEKKQFIIKDNVGFGEWDYDVLANEWDSEELDGWGLDVPSEDWAQLEYIEDDQENPALKSFNTITVSIAANLIDDREEILESIKDLMDNKYLGCEVK